jgi:hypothetical protein
MKKVLIFKTEGKETESQEVEGTGPALQSE